jgi:hypothetical protein
LIILLYPLLFGKTGKGDDRKTPFRFRIAADEREMRENGKENGEGIKLN